MLLPDPEIERQAEYAPADWDERMTTTPTVTTLPADSPLPARTLVVGVEAGGAEQGVSARAGAARHGRWSTPSAVCRSSSWSPRTAGRCGPSIVAWTASDREFVLVPGTGLPVLVDLSSGTEWSFAGEALRGPLSGRRLTRVPFLLDYWFDWQTYHPDTEVHRAWTPRPGRDRRLSGQAGRIATARSGAPLPPPIFIGRATIEAPRSGSRSSPVRFSNAGMLRA